MKTYGRQPTSASVKIKKERLKPIKEIPKAVTGIFLIVSVIILLVLKFLFPDTECLKNPMAYGKWAASDCLKDPNAKPTTVMEPVNHPESLKP